MAEVEVHDRYSTHRSDDSPAIRALRKAYDTERKQLNSLTEQYSRVISDGKNAELIVGEQEMEVGSLAAAIDTLLNERTKDRDEAGEN